MDGVVGQTCHQRVNADGALKVCRDDYFFACSVVTDLKNKLAIEDVRKDLRSSCKSHQHRLVGREWREHLAVEDKVFYRELAHGPWRGGANASAQCEHVQRFRID